MLLALFTMFTYTVISVATQSFQMVCISVGLIIKRIPWIGIVSVPMTNSTYHAVRSQGAFLNGNKIKVEYVTLTGKQVSQDQKHLYH